MNRRLRKTAVALPAMAGLAGNAGAWIPRGNPAREEPGRALPGAPIPRPSRFRTRNGFFANSSGIRRSEATWGFRASRNLGRELKFIPPMTFLLRFAALSLLLLPPAFSKPAWKPLFNGKSFRPEWTFVGDSSFWSIDPKDTSIVGFSATTSTPYSMLFSAKTYDEFTVKYAYRLKAGCSGFWFRTRSLGVGTSVEGPQVEAKREGNEQLEVGSIYVHPQPGWTVQHSRAWSIKAAPKPDDWQHVVLTVKKPNVYVNVNGVQAVGETDAALLAAGAKGPWNYTTGQYSKDPGQIALQVHKGYAIDIRFKAIEILEGCNDPASPAYGGATVPGMPKQPAVYQDNGDCAGTGAAWREDGKLAGYLGHARREGGAAVIEVGHPGPHALEILDLRGRAVFSGSAPGPHAWSLGPSVRAGLHWVRLTAGRETLVRKILIP